MDKISSLEQLINCFEEKTCSEQIGVLKELDIAKVEFEKFATWKEGGYTRNCLARRASFELILLCWDAGAITPIHDHGGQDCWVYQIAGSILERQYTKSDKHFQSPDKIILHEGKVTYMHDRMGYHSIENISKGRAMTLHIYANPIDRCNVLNESTGSFETREMDYDFIREDAMIAVRSD